MNTPCKQSGLTMISWLLVLLVAGFFATCAVKLAPAYIEAWTVGNSLNSAVKSDMLKGRISIPAIRNSLEKQFNTNRVDSEAIRARDVKITRKKGKLIIDARYEKRLPLMFNIDVVLKFDKLIKEVDPASMQADTSEDEDY